MQTPSEALFLAQIVLLLLVGRLMGIGSAAVIGGLHHPLLQDLIFGTDRIKQVNAVHSCRRRNVGAADL